MSHDQTTDQDSPWKEALEYFLAQFLAFFFPHISEAIDWSRGYESLDKELQKIAPDSRVGRRSADKLFKVWRKNGKEAWLLIHIEVQGRREKRFIKRMFTYWYRILGHYDLPVVSLAVLCDDKPGWKPDQFSYNELGCELGFRFPVAKILEYRGQEERLEADPNPFAALVLAQLKVLETRRMPKERWRWKLRVAKGLYERGLKRDDIGQLLRLIDWMITLREGLEYEFRQQIHQFEEERRMPYVTTFERFSKKEGLREGLLEGIALDLEETFGKADRRRLLEEIQAIEEVDQLRKVARALKKAKTPDDVRKVMRK